MEAPHGAEIPPGPVFHKAGFIVPHTIFLILTFTFVFLRLWARRLQKVALDGSDYCVFAATFFYMLLTIESYVGIAHGVGEHVQYLLYLDPTGSNISLQLKLLVSGCVMYLISLTFSKFSILILYRKVFPTKSMKLATSVIGIFILIISVGVCFLVVFSCNPLEERWNASMQGSQQCISLVEIFVYIGTLNIITDLACLLLPIREVLKLQLDKRSKYTVCGYFLAGGITTLVSIPRMNVVAKVIQLDPTLDIGNVSLWSCIEADVAIICVCLPVIWPAFRRIKEWIDDASPRISIFREKWRPSLNKEPGWRNGSSSGGSGLIEKDPEFAAPETHYYEYPSHLRRSTGTITPVPSWPSSGIVVEQSFEIKSLHTSKSVKHPNNKSARQSAADLLPELPELPPSHLSYQRYWRNWQPRSSSSSSSSNGGGGGGRYDVFESPKRALLRAHRGHSRLSDDSASFYSQSSRIESVHTVENKAWISVMMA